MVLLGFTCFFYFYSLCIVNVVSKHVYVFLIEKKSNLVVGKMKDEPSGVPIKRFVGSKSKMYTFIAEDKDECKEAKSID